MTLATAGIPAVTNTQPTMPQFATGSFTGDGSATANVNLGFTPKYFKLFDLTDVTSWEWVQGMPATNTWYDPGNGNRSIDTNTVIKTNGKLTTVTGVGVYDPNQGGANDGVLINTSLSVWAPDQTLTFNCQLSTNGLVNAKAYVWIAFG
jgi:hypothetical protein